VIFFQDRETPLPDKRLWAAFRGRAGVLGAGLKPGRALLLVHVQHSQRHSGKLN